MREYVASVLLVLLVLSSVPLVVAAQELGNISGTATLDNGDPAANYTVRLRHVDTGVLEAEVGANAQGEYEFTNVPAGNYLVEVVDRDGNIVGTSATVALAAGAAVVGVAIASAGAAAAVAGGIAGLTVAVTTAAAVGGGLLAVKIVRDKASGAS